MNTNKQTNRAALLAAVGSDSSDESTGCTTRMPEGGQLYSPDGERISDWKARKLFRDGYDIEAPNAGASSYRDILPRLGYKNIEVFDWSSSAGDWILIVRTGVVFQQNRYPGYGFIYSLEKHELEYATEP